jgi:toxin CptA
MCLPGQSEFVALRLLPDATVHPWITVLRLRDERDKSHLLVVTRDMTNKSDFRRLRVFLRWRAKFSEG